MALSIRGETAKLQPEARNADEAEGGGQGPAPTTDQPGRPSAPMPTRLPTACAKKGRRRSGGGSGDDRSSSSGAEGAESEWADAGGR